MTAIVDPPAAEQQAARAEELMASGRIPHAVSALSLAIGGFHLWHERDEAAAKAFERGRAMAPDDDASGAMTSGGLILALLGAQRLEAVAALLADPRFDARRKIWRERAARGAQWYATAELAAAVQEIASAGATVLEAGGGVGDIQITLLEAGADRATNVELSPSWEKAAHELLAEHGLEERVTRVLGNFVDVEVAPADIVILHRVVCCYSDWNGLLQTAAARTKKAMGLTFPVDRWWTKGFLALANLPNRWQRRTFRAYVHPPSEMIGTLTRSGLVVSHDRAGPVWRTVILQRRPELGGDGAQAGAGRPVP